jgi:hypothetical protein
MNEGRVMAQLANIRAAPLAGQGQGQGVIANARLSAAR